MREGFTRFLILIIVFVGGLNIVSVTGAERLAFDDARFETRDCLHTVCRMGEISQASLSAYLSSLPSGYGSFGIRISCLRDTHEGKMYIDDKTIREEVRQNAVFELMLGDEITIEIWYKEHFFLCKGRVNGLRR